MALAPRLLQELYGALGQALEQHLMPYPLNLVSPQIRMALKRLTARAIPRHNVLSYNELSPDVQVNAVGTVN